MKLLYTILALISPCRNCHANYSCLFCEHKKWSKYRSKKTWNYIAEKYESEEHEE